MYTYMFISYCMLVLEIGRSAVRVRIGEAVEQVEKMQIG